MIIYSCPGCDHDLIDEGFTLWCLHCETSVPYAQLAGVTDADLD